MLVGQGQQLAALLETAGHSQHRVAGWTFQQRLDGRQRIIVKAVDAHQFAIPEHGKAGGGRHQRLRVGLQRIARQFGDGHAGAQTGRDLPRHITRGGFIGAVQQHQPHISGPGAGDGRYPGRVRLHQPLAARA